MDTKTSPSNKEIFENLHFKILDQRNHILEKPGMYIGDVSKKQRIELLFNPENRELFKHDVEIPEAMIHLFIEILINASDNVYESRNKGIDPERIEVQMTEKRVSVKNYGRPIPIIIHEEYGMYNPLLVFGNLLSSSHYSKDQKRYSCGTNGLGAKLTNVWSKYFKVEVKDSFHSKNFVATWLNNMENTPIWEVKKYSGDENSVKIEWDLDFERFGYTQYPPETAGIFCRHLLDVSVASKIPVVFNEHSFDISNPFEYCKLYWGEELVSNALFYREYMDGSITTKPELDKGKIPIIEIVYLDTPDSGTHISIANAMYTIDGGPYLDTAFSAFSKHALSNIKSQESVRLTIRDIKLHTSIFLNCLVENAAYLGQSKTKLLEPNINLSKIPQDFFKNVKKWKLVQRLRAEIEAKQFLKLKQTDGKRQKIFSDKLEDATMVNKKPENCVLHVCEGDSATSLPRFRMAFTGGHQYNGILSLGGKIVNVTEADLDKIKDSDAIQLLKQALNLHEGVDYSLLDNKKKLKYGLVSIETDADDDGKHICALLINYFNRFYPSLLKIGMISYLYLPVVKVFKGKSVVARIYSDKEFDDWKKKNTEIEIGKGAYYAHYYKGLGCYEKDEVKDDIQHTPNVKIIYDDDAADSLRLAFHPDMRNARKEWITKYRQLLGNINFEIVSMTEWRQDITSYINNQLIDYSLANITRSIPSYIDGLKNVQRKILFALLEKCHWKWQREKIKVASFAGRIMETMAYHHGTKALEDSIMKMAQSFVGSNNLPLLEARSQIGTRNKGGKDAPSGRYASIALAKYTPYIFRRELNEMMPRKMEDGEEIEPEKMIPIIPMFLTNRNSGIATGYSSDGPCYHPRDLIKWIREKCSGIEIPSIPQPYFHGFHGKIESKLSSIENEVILDSECTPDKDSEGDRTEIQLRLITYGKYDVKFNNKRNHTSIDVIITELPIGRWTLPYIEKLETMNKNKKFCNAILNNTNEETERPCIIIEDIILPEITPTSLFLIKSIGLQNITVLDRNGLPRKYTIPQILQRYYEDTISIISTYRVRLLVQLKEDISLCSNRIKFIEAIINQTIKTSNKNGTPRDEEDILNDMNELNIKYSKKILDSAKINGLTSNKLEKLKNQLTEIKQNYKNQKSKTAQIMWCDYLDELENYLPY
jgi:DNA topoisomerase-2